MSLKSGPEITGLQGMSLQDRLAVTSIARDDPSTLPGDYPFPRAH